MMKLVTGEEMKSIDAITIERHGIPSLVLMERAGESVVNRIEELFPRRRVTVVSGSGNNGGDGIVVGRILRSRDWDVRVFVLGKKSKLSPDCLSQVRIAEEMGIDIEFRERVRGSEIRNSVIVDALFGTGLNKPVRGHLLNVISVMNKSRSPVVSVDMPSGISSDTGEVMGKAVRADYTVTFGLPKIGHYLYPGTGHRGQLFVEDIGFPKDLTSSDRLRRNLVGLDLVGKSVGKRSPDSHKGTYGHIFVIAGSEGKTGAALLAARAAMRSGAGAVTLGVPDTLFGIFQANVHEEMTLALPSCEGGTVSGNAASLAIDFMNERADVVLLGPGLGINDDVKRFVREIVLNTKIPLVIDADGLSTLGHMMTILRKTKVEVTVTPHPGEMKRLLTGRGDRLMVREINKRRIEIAEAFAKTHNVICVLKGVPTVIASPNGSVSLNPTGNPGMATAGSGDVLSGIISSFAAQGFGTENAAVCGVYMHGLAGDIARDEVGEYSLIASDIIEHLPNAFKLLEECRKRS